MKVIKRIMLRATEDKAINIALIGIAILLFFVLIRSVLMKFHLSTRFVQPFVMLMYLTYFPATVLVVLTSVVKLVIALIRKSHDLSRKMALRVLFFLAVLVFLFSLLFMTGSYWELVLTNDTAENIVFESTYCEGSDALLPVPRNSTRYFYCNVSQPICKYEPKNICVDGIGCGQYAQDECDGFYGLPDVNIKTTELNNMYPHDRRGGGLRGLLLHIFFH